MAATKEIKKKMEEERNKKGTQVEEQDCATHHPLMPREPHIWLMITDGENDSERHIFYSITEDRCYIRFISELQNKYVACCYGGLLVLRDKSTNNCSILNNFTMERLHLPPLNTPPHCKYNIPLDCVMSSSKMDRSCRVIFFNRGLRKFWSCHLGDSEFIERESTYGDAFIINNLINFKGKLYALTAHDHNLIASDFSDPDLHHEQVISGESLEDLIFTGLEVHIYLVESCDDLLLIFMGSFDHEICDVKIFKADFSIGKWVELETLGDRTIFLGSRSNSFSAPASAVGMKANAVYWVRPSFGWPPPQGHLYMYDIEDKSISMSLPFSIFGTYSSLFWVSFPMAFNDEKKPKQNDTTSLFEVSPTETNFHVQGRKATIKSTELHIVQKKITQKRKETKPIVRKESLWADLHNDLLLEIFSHLLSRENVAFRSVCRSWYSISPSTTTQQFIHPLKSSDRSSPVLMCPNNKAYDPINDKLYRMNCSGIIGATVRAARDGWLLMDFASSELFFFNPFTKKDNIFFFPDNSAMLYYSVYFSKPPISSDCLVVVAIMSKSGNESICFMNWGDENWTCREISPEEHSFDFSYSNGVVYNGLYYFLGDDAKLLIFNPEKDEVHVIEAPKFISELKVKCGQQYMLESDGKLIAVFVGTDGSSIYTCQWNACRSEWEILGSLGNIVLFVSRPLSLSKTATVSGTGNKIYFPRVVGDGNILFYSLATKRYHTFEMGTSYSNFLASKFYPHYNGWFMR